MTALLKYEIRKTWIAKAIILGIAAVAELVFLAGLLNGNMDDNHLLLTGIFLLCFTAFGGVLFIGVQSVVTLHRDMNTKQGYMLYMTPRSSFRILGSKVLENGLSLLAAGIFFFLLALADVSLMFSRYGRIEMLWQTLRQFLETFGSRIPLDRTGYLLLTVSFLVSWLSTVCIAFLADIISSALLNGRRFNGLTAFLLFIALSLLFGWLERVFVAPGTALNTSLLIQSAVAVVYSAAMYMVSAVIMDRYLSV